MAERSKAPDWKIVTFLKFGVFGFQMEGWVQIPILATFYREGYFYLYIL